MLSDLKFKYFERVFNILRDESEVDNLCTHIEHVIRLHLDDKDITVATILNNHKNMLHDMIKYEATQLRWDDFLNSLELIKRINVIIELLLFFEKNEQPEQQVIDRELNPLRDKTMLYNKIFEIIGNINCLYEELEYLLAEYVKLI